MTQYFLVKTVLQIFYNNMPFYQLKLFTNLLRNNNYIGPYKLYLRRLLGNYMYDY